jgi:Carboxypeptidase regulatory-like domain
MLTFMNTSIRKVLFSLSLILSSAFFAAAMPSLDVTVSDSGSKLAYKGKTGASGTFATGTLAPGKYTVQFRSNGNMPGNYALLISAGKQKVMAEAVPGSKFSQGGVAMRLDVSSGLNITGQVSTGKVASADMSSNARVKIVNGKKYVWKGPEVGSNFGGHWEEEGKASAHNTQSVDSSSLLELGNRR